MFFASHHLFAVTIYRPGLDQEHKALWRPSHQHEWSPFLSTKSILQQILPSSLIRRDPVISRPDIRSRQDFPKTNEVERKQVLHEIDGCLRNAFFGFMVLQELLNYLQPRRPELLEDSTMSSSTVAPCKLEEFIYEAAVVLFYIRSIYYPARSFR